MKIDEIRPFLNKYDNTLKLYSDLLSQKTSLTDLEPQVEIFTLDQQTFKIKAFGKSVEVRFSMLFNGGSAQGVITAFLTGSENCQPFEKKLLEVSYDELGNPLGSTGISFCINEEDSLRILVVYILDNLINETLTKQPRKIKTSSLT